MIRKDVFYSAEQMKLLDSYAVELGVTEKELMQSAGNAVFEQVACRIKSGKIAVVCGVGNNGGDGYAAALLLQKNAFDVTVICVDEPKTDSSVFYKNAFLSQNGKVLRYAENTEQSALVITEADAVIDALFGFSFRGGLSGVYAQLTELINSASGVVISVDIPSGVYADGTVSDGCVVADVTCTFTANKPATVSYPAYGYCGEVVLCDIGVPENAFKSVSPVGQLLGEQTLAYLPKRPQNSNKSTFGTLLALCGSPDMTGAAYLAAMGALRSGVGLVELMSDSETLSVLKNRLSETVFSNFNREGSKRKNNAFLVGCGIGNVYDNVLSDVLKQQSKQATTIIDADGINYLARHINVLTEMQGDIILTPHPAEMARLTETTAEYVNANRIESARQFAMEFGCVLVLKGNKTVIASPNGEVSICPIGNSALSKGGSGDVLAGVIASLSAQGISAYRAACLGVYVHALASENLSETMGERCVLPSDLPIEIGRLLG